jgi:hypothetical protein
MKASDIKHTLHELGFTENCIVETILVTTNPDGSNNPAPMGIVFDGALLECRPFNTSNTCRNLTNEREASVLVFNNPIVFLKTAFKDEIVDLGTIDETLDKAEAIVLTTKTGETTLSDLKTSFRLQPIDITIKNDKPLVFSRGRAMAIEAIIHATRVKVFNSQNQESEVKSLLTRMRYCFNVIQRVSDVGSVEMIVVDALKKLMKDWGISI